MIPPNIANICDGNSTPDCGNTMRVGVGPSAIAFVGAIVFVGVSVGISVGMVVGMEVVVGELLGVGVLVGVGVGVLVGVGVKVPVGVGVGVKIFVGVGVGDDGGLVGGFGVGVQFSQTLLVQAQRPSQLEPCPIVQTPLLQ